MPNHITNILKVTGSPEDVAACLESIRGGEDEQYIDFNKIKPMPETLNVTAGSSVDSAIDVIQNNTAKFKEMLNYPWAKEKGIDTVEKMIEQVKSKLTQKDYDEAMMSIDNQIKYGCKNWYDWSILHWGTKWNAYDQTFDDDSTITFDTAWSSPFPVIEELSKKFPTLHFTVEYADEDIGNNCGVYEFDGGVCIGQYEHEGVEATMFAVKIKGWNVQEYVIDRVADWSVEELEGMSETIVEIMENGLASDLVSSLNKDDEEYQKKAELFKRLALENELYEAMSELE